MLIVVITVVGVLAAIAIPGWNQLASVRVAAAARRLIGDMRYVQDLSIRTQAVHTVTFSSTGYSIQREGQGLIEDPSFKGQPFVVDLTSDYPGITVSASFKGNQEFSFQKRGNPTSGGSVTLSLGGENVVVRIEDETGRVSY